MHDPSRFEVFVYALNSPSAKAAPSLSSAIGHFALPFSLSSSVPSSSSPPLASLPLEWAKVVKDADHTEESFATLSVEEQAQIIRDRDRIDILVDLDGYTTNENGVLALRPAPIQIGFLGWPATSGDPLHDYIVVGRTFC
jgi:predicted O-linked N-acetylglucosamine transferase (SPINDLY family)